MDQISKPIDSQWTDDQWEAIIQTGKNMLVAAAAGSGKTAVLVERIIKKVTHPSNPVDVDTLLIVTFTNATAAEMRKRIAEALEAELEKQPSSLYLRRQLSLLNRASISTLHSFCMNLIRKYYYKLEIDPGFRIVDETEAEFIRQEVIDELFEEEYSKDNNEAFFKLVDWYSNDRSDLELQTIIRHLYDFSRSYPVPGRWLNKIKDNYSIQENTKLEELPWITELLNDITLQLKAAKEMLYEALRICQEPEGPTPYLESISKEVEWVESLANAGEISWEVLYNSISTDGFGRLKSCKKGECDEVLQNQAKNLRDKAKDQITKLKDEFFVQSPDMHIRTIRSVAPYVDSLVTLVGEYGERFLQAKQEKGLVDFSDLEHYCLTLLSNQIEGYEGEPSEIAREIQQSYSELLVDEYQDTNLVQETILKLVSSGSNMFMVGDVKQSIYRFRLAEPGLFLMKYKQYGLEPKSGTRIDLSKNFRSRKEVLDGTNFIFKQIMNEKVGEIDYDIDAELKIGASYPERTAEVDVLLVNRNEAYEPEAEEEDERISIETAEAEARVIAKKINDFIKQSYQIVDKKTGEFRSVTYRDFVILLRSFSGASTIMEEFKKRGIPSYAELSTGYFEAVEVSIMLSVLKVIDNPYQDIPLVSVLRSPIVGLTEEDLAQIRIDQKSSSFFNGITLYQEKSDNEIAKKLNSFLTLLTNWRERARQGSLAELIWQIYRDTRYYDFVGGLSGGKQRQANLRSLYDRAKQYEATSFRGLFRFLRFIERMQDRGDDLGAAKALGEQEDVVRLMTIHKSKGLEFPIVFVAGINKQFNKRDLYDKVLLHKELGFGSKFIDLEARVSFPTLPFLAIKQKIQMELLAEEMRVLYVALTRAKEKLILVGTIKDALTSIEKWSAFRTHSIWELPDHSRANAKSYLDWIGPALIRHRDVEQCLDIQNNDTAGNVDVTTHPSRWSIKVIDTLSDEEIREEFEINEIENALKKGKKVTMESDWKDKIVNQLSWNYPYKEAEGKRSKLTVTEIKRQQEQLDPYSVMSDNVVQKNIIASRPRFLQEKALTSAEIGTAMHLVMQHVDLKKDVTENSIKMQIEQMLVKELMTEQQAKEINIYAIVDFFKTEIGNRVKLAKNVYREVPFSLGLPATDVYKELEHSSKEKVLLQGIIDCLFEDSDGLVIIDYKTDRIGMEFNKIRPRLIERYQTQVTLYKQAVEQIWKKPVKETYLYFFDGSHVCKF